MGLRLRGQNEPEGQDARHRYGKSNKYLDTSQETDIKKYIKKYLYILDNKKMK